MPGLSLPPLRADYPIRLEEEITVHLSKSSTQPTTIAAYRLPLLQQGDIIGLAINNSFMIQLIIEPAPNRTQSGSIRHNHLPAPRCGIYFDEQESRFFVDGKPMPHTLLTDLEHRLLKHLYQNMEQVCSYLNLAEHVWLGYADDNTICQLISRLRRKINSISPGAQKRYLKTSYGNVRGYMLTHRSSEQ